MGDMYCCPFANTLFHFLCQFPSGLGPAALSPIFWQHPATSTTKLAGQKKSAKSQTLYGAGFQQSCTWKLWEIAWDLLRHRNVETIS